MNDLREIARAAIARLSSVVHDRTISPPGVNANLDFSEPLVALFDALADEIDALKRQVAELQQAR